MKAITIWQPWATLIAEGLKPFEFRHWPAPRGLRGQRIAIHAGARAAKRNEIQDILLRLMNCEPMGISSAAIGPLNAWLTAPGMLPLSSVLCTAVLGEPIRNAELAAAIDAEWINDSDRPEHSNWGWPLTDIVRLHPFVPARGAQGFWDWAPPTQEDAA